MARKRDAHLVTMSYSPYRKGLMVLLGMLVLSAGVAYDSAMVDEEDLTPDLPMGEQWRFGLGAQYQWSESLTIGGAYELMWTGDLNMDINRGPLAGRVSGTYEDTSMHFINVNLIWKF